MRSAARVQACAGIMVAGGLLVGGGLVSACYHLLGVGAAGLGRGMSGGTECADSACVDRKTYASAGDGRQADGHAPLALVSVGIAAMGALLLLAGSALPTHASVRPASIRPHRGPVMPEITTRHTPVEARGGTRFDVPRLQLTFRRRALPRNARFPDNDKDNENDGEPTTAQGHAALCSSAASGQSPPAGPELRRKEMKLVPRAGKPLHCKPSVDDALACSSTGLAPARSRSSVRRATTRSIEEVTISWARVALTVARAGSPRLSSAAPGGARDPLRDLVGHSWLERAALGQCRRRPAEDRRR